MTRSRARSAALVVTTIVLAAAAGAGGYFGGRAWRPSAAPPPTRPAVSTPAAYPGATGRPSPAGTPSAAPVPARAALATALGPALRSAALGSSVHLQIRDASTGALLLARNSTRPAAPASTAKLLTATAVLTAYRPTDRLVTRVVPGPGGSVVLVGAGDPTLSGARAGRPTPYAHAARISDLARQLRAAHVVPRRILVDGSAFVGPAVSPSWAAEDVPSDYGSAITALMADGGRAAPGDAIRSAAPDLAAGRQLAVALGRPGLAVATGRAPAGARAVATVRSATIGELVAQMLQTSDNTIAECLSRAVALREGRPASFLGGAAAVRAVLTRLGVDPGAGMVDGSGLAPRDRVSVATLSRLLALAATGRRPALTTLLEGLPVAAWSGTLDNRYLGGSAAGLVRAKTGTLTGVSALAGLVHDRSGRLLVFAVIADRTGSTPDAEAALDALITRLARCGC